MTAEINREDYATLLLRHQAIEHCQHCGGSQHALGLAFFHLMGCPADTGPLSAPALRALCQDTVQPFCVRLGHGLPEIAYV